MLTPRGGCKRCPRKLVDFVPATLADGPVIWLGEAPGAQEVKEQQGFVGKSGQRLRSEATDAGVPGPWSFSNTIHCRPPENAAPKPPEIECCLSQFVLNEIRNYKYVVMCGAVPLRALFPKAQATHFRGNFAHHPDFPEQLFYAMHHPAAILRNPTLSDLYTRHMQRLARAVRGERRTDPWRQLLTGPAGMDALAEMVRAPLLSLDLETNRTESWLPDVQIKSFCATADGETVAAVASDDPHFVAALELLRRFLERKDATVVGANVAFDVELLERDLEFRAACTPQDVAIQWYEAEQYKAPSLKQLVGDQLDGYSYLVHHPHTVTDVDLLLRYNAEDVVHSLDLFRKALDRLRPKTLDLTTRVLGPYSLVSRRMQTHGLYLRETYRQAKVAEYTEKRREAVAAWKAADPAFIPSVHESGDGLREYLFNVRGLPAIGVTDKGMASTDKAAIKEWIRGGADYLQHLLTIRSIDKTLGTYFKPFAQHAWPDSRVRPKHWLTTTDTSRQSSSDPNVYNIPKPAEVRDLFGAPPGAVLLESDLSQIEFRIMVCLAKDETGIAGYLRGDDAHTMTARAISGNPSPTKGQRSQAKPVNFGFLYGGGANTAKIIAANDYGVLWTDDEAERFRRTFMETYQRIPEFHTESRRRLIRNRGHFDSVTGHHWHYRDWDHSDQAKRDHEFRAALNAEAQGPASNICNYIAVLARGILDQRGFQTVAFVNSVYDSIMTEVPDPRWVPAVVEAMNDATKLAYEWVRAWLVVPLVIEHAVGESWGSLEAYQ